MHLKINISKNQLENYYLEKKLSTDAIAKIFNCNHVTVINYLKRFGIPRRPRLGNRQPVSTSREVLHDLYWNKKLSHKQIAEKLGHSRYGIQRWMKIYGIKSRDLSTIFTKYPKSDFSNNLNEKAYLIGFRLGDLNVYKVNRLIQVRCSTTILEQADLMKNLFKKYGNVHIVKAKRGTYEITILLNNSFSFLLPKKDKIEGWILKKDTCFLSFLAGYADAEGSYYLRKPYKYLDRNSRYDWGVFEIQTYDKNIISTINRVLKNLGIICTFSKSRSAGYIDKRGVRTNKDCWRVTVAKKQSLWNLIKILIPYHKHKKKLKEMNILRNNLLLRNSQPYCKPINL
ncbi:MAG: hypothetical protein UR81_C0003G0007 [Candidatus Levybacteria bacterium GW2011_GWB1_35_5]|nr:MAG: hypothetical protein UR81_C0003G0007 [Candidatus Levybacteria bacterium GW2011_GWB1_35_5]